MVMYGGRVMETAPSRELLRHPTHPYTRLLLAATPGNAVREMALEKGNQAPNLFEGRMGCPFADRCVLTTGICREVEPPVESVDQGHSVACHHVV